MVYSQLSVADVGGSAHHITKKHEDDKNGYVAWNSLYECYDGDAVKNETVDSLISKLESYHLTLASNASQYINNFLTSFQ